MKPTMRSISASVGNLTSGFAFGAPAPVSPAAASGFMPPGSGKPLASSSRLSTALLDCRRPIASSSAARSSGTARQAHPVVSRPHTETWPVRPSSRTKLSSTR